MAASLQELLRELSDGRTDRVFDLVPALCPATHADSHGVDLMQHCAYFGDVSAIRHLLSQGAAIRSLGENLGLSTAAFHGHWQLCRFLLDHDADANHADPDTGETALHSAVSQTDRLRYDRIVAVLLAAGANPSLATKPGVETGAFMRDCRTKGETPLHRAAAFGSEETIQILLNAGASIDARDANGETPLSWASWYGRPASVIRLLCYGRFRISPAYKGMRSDLIGYPHESK